MRCQLGSPPLTREKQNKFGEFALEKGITPAYAGKTHQPVILFLCSRDHPRLRGKNLSCEYQNPWLVGSPPLTREKPKFLYALYISVRITPAYAGKTESPLWGKINPDGSPPLTREKPHPALCIRL